MCLNGSLLLTFLCSAASGVSDSLWHCGLHPARLLCPWEFSSQEYWGGFPCPPSGDLPNPGIGPRSPECRQILGVTLEYMNSVPPLWGLLILHQAPHTHTHTQAHTHTHIHTGTHTCTHTGTHTRTHTGTHIHMHTHSRHWPPKLCYFYVFHPSSLATLIKLEFDTTPIDKIRLYKVVSKNSRL